MRAGDHRFVKGAEPVSDLVIECSVLLKPFAARFPKRWIGRRTEPERQHVLIERAHHSRSVVRLHGHRHAIVVPHIARTHERGLRALQDRTIGKTGVSSESVVADGGGQAGGNLVGDVERASAAVGPVRIDVNVADRGKAVRLDMDAYNASQRVTAWFTPDDCVVLEQ